MKEKKLPYVHRRGGGWASLDTPHPLQINREVVSHRLTNHLLIHSQGRRLSDLNNSYSPVGNKAKLDFIDAYKNISILSQKNKLNKLEDSPSVAYLQRCDKIRLNPEPFGMVRRTGPDTSIDIHNYSMGDVYANAFSEGINHCKDVKDLNISDNRLTEPGCVKILQNIKDKKMKKINLAENKIGSRSIYELIDIVSIADTKLRWLDIESTGVSDKTVAQLCKALGANKTLSNLNLAKNNLGYFSACALKGMLKVNNTLKRLDLHWNNFRTQGAQELFEGLGANTGLIELDISWNSFGRESSVDVARSLGLALKSNKELLHLDISYSYFSKNECEVIAELLSFNHTILGLHALGNDCAIDSKGFMLPNEFTAKMQQSHFFHRILNNSSKSPTSLKAKPKRKSLGNCWICDKWVEVIFVWTPGISGEASMPPIYLHLEHENYAAELMTKQKDGSFQLIRVLPPSRISFFFSNRSSTMKSSEFKSQLLPEPFTFDSKTVSYLNYHHFEGEVCRIKEPFSSKARMIGDAYQAGATEYEKLPWSISTSVFKDYRLDTPDFLYDCFEFDWKASKLANFVKAPEVQEQVKTILRGVYEYVVEAYRTLSAYSGNELFCVTQNVLIEFLNDCKVIDSLFQVSDLGVNWNSANAGKEKGEIYNAGNGLCRYEFMEILVRIANDRFCRNKICKNAAEALEKMLNEHYLAVLKSYDNRVFRGQVLMVEEVDYFVKAHKVVFEALFKKYSGRKATPGQKPFTSLEELRMLCAEAGIISDSFTTREIDVCYSQAMTTQIDYLFKKRHLEMSFPEFLEAVCRAAALTSVEDSPDASLRDKLAAIVPDLLSVCPQSVRDSFVIPTEETYFRMMYKAKAYS